MKAGDFKTKRERRHEHREEQARLVREFRCRVGSPDTGGLTPQAIHHYRKDDQIHALIEAGQAEPGMGFITALLATCSLPRKDPGDSHQYIRRNGPFCLYLSRGGEECLPFGILPRLLLAWVCTEVVRTGSPKLYFGPSLASFMRELGINSSDSAGRTGVRTRLRDQMHRLFSATLRLTYESEEEMNTQSLMSPVAVRTNFWWEPGQFKKVANWRSTIELGKEFFEEIREHPVPIDLNVLRAMKRSSLGVDVYLWLAYRMNRIHSPVNLPWRQLYRQFAPYPEETAPHLVTNFRRDMLRELGKIKLAWPGLKYDIKHGKLQLQPSARRIERRAPAGFSTA